MEIDEGDHRGMLALSTNETPDEGTIGGDGRSTCSTGTLSLHRARLGETPTNRRLRHDCRFRLSTDGIYDPSSLQHDDHRLGDWTTVDGSHHFGFWTSEDGDVRQRPTISRTCVVDDLQRTWIEEALHHCLLTAGERSSGTCCWTDD